MPEFRIGVVAGYYREPYYHCAGPLCEHAVKTSGVSGRNGGRIEKLYCLKEGHNQDSLKEMLRIEEKHMGRPGKTG